MVGLSDIQTAVERIGPYVHETPLIRSSSLSTLTECEVFLKAENLQKTGSFKVRGAFSKLCGLKAERVIAASMGNHAQGVAHAARRLGIHATIVMPVTAPIVKEEATRGYGAEVVLQGDSFGAALDYARSRKDAAFIHPFDDELIIAGQGTIAIEILRELPDADVLLVPVGGGGLISGVAAAAKALSPKLEVIGVQAASAQSAVCSFSEKRIVAVPPSSTLADGIAVGAVGSLCLEHMTRFVDDMLVVDEAAIAAAILLLLERKKIVAEGAGAVPLAALIPGRERFKGKKVVLVISGGNIDFTIVDRIIHQGLLAEGRIAVFEVEVEDIPGSLHVLTGLIAAHRANILDVRHERYSPGMHAGRTRLVITTETRGARHGDEIVAELAAKGYEVMRRW